MRNLYALILLAVVLTITACSDSTTEETPPPKNTPEKTTTSTDNNGNATVNYTNGAIKLRVTEFDTNLALPGVIINAIELTDGLLVWAIDNAGTYYPNAILISYDIEIQPSILLYSTQSDNNFGFNYTTKPTGLTELFHSSIEQSCITGNVVDALLAISNDNTVSVDGLMLRISGAPAETVDESYIYLGFSKEILQTAYMDGTLNSIINDLGGILESDTQSICWTMIGSDIPPLLDVNVTREQTDFYITNIDALDIYPYSPSPEELITTIDISWDGNPNTSGEFTAILTAVCAPDINCFPGEYVTVVENPVVRPFGCWGDAPNNISGFSTWQVSLRDVDGLETPPATYTMRCGQNAIDANSTQWGSKFWSATNIYQNTLGTGWTQYKFENFPNAPVPNLDILDFGFITDDTDTLKAVNFSYHNTGVDPESLNEPPRYVYKLDCDVNACDNIEFDLARRLIILDKVDIPAVPRVPNSNNFANGVVRISGNLVW